MQEVGLSALWLIYEKNDTLRTLKLCGNGVGGQPRDAPASRGCSRRAPPSSASTSRRTCSATSIPAALLGRGSARTDAAHLNVSNNSLLPDGVKIVCNALKTCTAMKYLDLSYNSPGAAGAHLAADAHDADERRHRREGADDALERTWWLDTRAKEAMAARCSSRASRCVPPVRPVRPQRGATELAWRSTAACDAILLAGVLRGNTVLKTLNITQGGSLGDFEREELGNAILANKNGKLGFCDIYGLKENMSPTHSVDLKDKEQIRSLRSFTLFAGLLRANSAITTLTLASVNPEHVDLIAEALATNTTMQELRLEQPNKGGETAIAVLPVQELNGNKATERIDLWEAGSGGAMHRQACAVVGALMNVNTSVRFLASTPAARPRAAASSSTATARARARCAPWTSPGSAWATAAARASSRRCWRGRAAS